MTTVITEGLEEHISELPTKPESRDIYLQQESTERIPKTSG